MANIAEITIAYKLDDEGLEELVKVANVLEFLQEKYPHEESVKHGFECLHKAALKLRARDINE